MSLLFALTPACNATHTDGGDAATDASSASDPSDATAGSDNADAASPGADNTERCSGTPVSVVELTARGWSPASTPDPLGDHQPPVIDCHSLASWYPEEDNLEVDTGRCNYLDLSQTLPATLSGPGHLTATLTHFDLVAEVPAQSHAALLLGEEILWEVRENIPSPAFSRKINVTLPRTPCSGDVLRFHLHNHGQNTWQLSAVHISALP